MNLNIDQTKLQEICRNYNVRRLWLFGSVLTDQFHEDSDIDVLVEFPDNETPGLFDLGGLQQELTELLGRTVDLKTPDFFDERNREQILEESSLEYDRAA